MSSPREWWITFRENGNLVAASGVHVGPTVPHLKHGYTSIRLVERVEYDQLKAQAQEDLELLMQTAAERDALKAENKSMKVYFEDLLGVDEFTFLRKAEAKALEYERALTEIREKTSPEYAVHKIADEALGNSK